MGKTFTFRAQPALDLRRREHDAHRRVLATAQFELSSERRRFDEVRDTLCEARENLGRRMHGPHEGHDVAWHRVWIARLEQSHRARATAVEAAEGRVARALEACAVARQRLESLARMKEKTLRSWNDAERAREQRELDAVATMRFDAAVRENALRSIP
jgi:flagellar export protein FliJ